MSRQIGLLPSEWPELTEVGFRCRTRKGHESQEEMFATQLQQVGIQFERQVLFAKAEMGRLWKLDFGFRPYMLAVEIEGIVPRRVGNEFVAGGRHGSVAGIIEDMDKYNSAALLGWTVLRFPQKYVRSRRAIDFTLMMLQTRGWNRRA